MRFLIGAVAALLMASPVAAAPAELGYDFEANTPLAHVVRGGVVADAATLGFVKYIRDKSQRWKTGVTEGGRTAALMPGVQANLWLPISPELAKQDLVLEAGMMPFGAGQRMDPFLNGKKAGNVTIKGTGWQNIRIKLAKGSVKAGFAKVRLHFRRSVNHGGFKSAGAVRFVRIVPASTPAAPTDEAALKALLAIRQGAGLHLPAGEGLDYYLTPPSTANFVGQATGEVEVWGQLDGRKPVRLGGGTGALKISLKRVGGKAVRLMLRAKGGDATLTGARLTGPAKATIAVKKPKYVVFWLIDTLRADKLKFYEIPNANGRKVKTPNLSALAKESVVVEPFWVPGNESKASHASLFTGTYPVRHRVFTEKAKLSSSHLTIAEAFKAAGFRTAGFISNGYVSKKWNYAQGFMDYVNFIREGKANSAKAVVKKAKRWISKHKAKPFYLYLGTSDPHVTYRAHKQFIGDYDRGYEGRFMKYLSGTELGKIKGRKSPPRARDRKRIEGLYENEVAFNDFHFGELVKHLKAEGIWDETLVIVGSDHGDEFWEHGGCGHGHSLHQELINVPLMVRYPGVLPAGRLTAGADGVDLLPTILDLLGSTLPKDNQGQSLLPFVGVKNAYPNALMASMGVGQFAIQVGRAKALFRSDAAISIFDVKKDPSERENLYGKRLVLTMAALDPLAIFLASPKTWNKAKQGAPNNLLPR